MILPKCRVFNMKPQLSLCKVEEFVLLVSWLPFAFSCQRWTVQLRVCPDVPAVLPGARSTLYGPDLGLSFSHVVLNNWLKQS